MSDDAGSINALRMRCEDEVIALHRFFQAWYRGEIEDPHGEAFSRVSEVLSEEFHIVTPDGEMLSRSDIMTRIRRGYGSKPADFRIRTEKCHFRVGGRGIGVVTYEEWHDESGEGGPSQGRLSTAVFQDRADAPHGVRWVHVHETWL